MHAAAKLNSRDIVEKVNYILMIIARYGDYRNSDNQNNGGNITAYNGQICEYQAAVSHN